MGLAIEHLKKHWLSLVIGFFLLGIILNFNTIAYFVTRDKNVVENIQADALKTRMFFAPASGSFRTGDLIAISVRLDSTRTPINVVGGEIVFPVDKLEIKSISTKDSINTFWIPTDPHFSTTTNTIMFFGGLASPGFLGIGGNVLTVVFQAKVPGSIELSLTNTSILANDGLGTAVAVPSQLANFSVVTPPATTYLPEDLNQDGKVNLTDLSILISNWGIPQNKDTDLSGDGTVGTKDLSILLSKLTLLVLPK